MEVTRLVGRDRNLCPFSDIERALVISDAAVQAVHSRDEARNLVHVRPFMASACETRARGVRRSLSRARHGVLRSHWDRRMIGVPRSVGKAKLGEPGLEAEPCRGQDVRYRPRRRSPTGSSATQGDPRTPVLISDCAGDGICAGTHAPEARDARGHVLPQRIDPELAARLRRPICRPTTPRPSAADVGDRPSAGGTEHRHRGAPTAGAHRRPPTSTAHHCAGHRMPMILSGDPVERSPRAVTTPATKA